MNQTTKDTKRKLIVREREIAFPDESAERAFKNALAKTPLVSGLFVAEAEGRKIYNLSVRPSDFNEFRRQLKARGLENCPTTNYLFDLLIRSADEKINFTTCLN